VLIVLAVVLVGLVGGAGVIWLSLLVAGPALAATTSGPRGVLCVGLLAAVLGAALGIRGGLPGRELVAVLSGLAAVTLASGLSGALRGRRERVLAAVRSVAEAAQHALLRPVPATVGPFQVAVRYSAAAAEARIGGDLYALLPTPYGVRLIVGDVRGKGLPDSSWVSSRRPPTTSPTSSPSSPGSSGAWRATSVPTTSSPPLWPDTRRQGIWRW
jgi:hypothetical protein